jgi:hypothetical protein
VASLGKKIHAYVVSITRPVEMGHLEDIGVDGGQIKQTVIKKYEIL